jgi:hypothetical protein
MTWDQPERPKALIFTLRRGRDTDGGLPKVSERLNQRGDEYIGHGRTNAERQEGLWEEDEARLIAECTASLKKYAGKPPRGWLGPYIVQNPRLGRPE